MAAEAIAAGRVVEQLHLTRPSGETIVKVDMTPLAKIVGYPFMGITRYALQRVLLGHLEDGDVELGARLQELDTHEAEGITELWFEGQADAVRARAVIGADGRRCGTIAGIARINPYPPNTPTVATLFVVALRQTLLGPALGSVCTHVRVESMWRRDHVLLCRSKAMLLMPVLRPRIPVSTTSSRRATSEHGNNFILQVWGRSKTLVAEAIRPEDGLTMPTFVTPQD